MAGEVLNSSRGHVIVVEDSHHTRNIFNYFFRQNGFGVLSYKDGTEAWQQIKDMEIPNLLLVLSDIMMPGLNGVELVQKMRTHERYKETPIIFISAVTDRDTVQAAKDLGVKAYLLKPVSASRILECLRKVFPDEDFIEIKMGG